MNEARNLYGLILGAIGPLLAMLFCGSIQSLPIGAGGTNLTGTAEIRRANRLVGVAYRQGNDEVVYLFNHAWSRTVAAQNDPTWGIGIHSDRIVPHPDQSNKVSPHVNRYVEMSRCSNNNPSVCSVCKGACYRNIGEFEQNVFDDLSYRYGVSAEALEQYSTKLSGTIAGPAPYTLQSCKTASAGAIGKRTITNGTYTSWFLTNKTGTVISWREGPRQRQVYVHKASHPTITGSYVSNQGPAPDHNPPTATDIETWCKEAAAVCGGSCEITEISF